MNLYHVISTYHLLSAMIHKSKQQEAATLVLSKWILEKYPNIDELKSIFDNVVVMDADFGFLHTDNETEQYILSILGNPKDYDTIYIWGAHFTLGYHLAKSAIPFIYCEDGAGLYSRPDVLRATQTNNPLKSLFHERFEKLGLYDGTTDCITNVLCNNIAQHIDFIPQKSIIDFNVLKELTSLPDEVRKKILQFFLGDKTFHIHENSLLILTQHLTNLRITTFEEQALAYQLLVDYFFPGRKLVFKSHPDDLMYYSQLFPEAQVIREKFPSEFLPFVLDKTLNGVATISSTAIYNLRGYFNETFELDNRWDKTFEMTHRYYAAVRIAQQLQLDIVCHPGTNEILVQRLCQTLEGQQPEVYLNASSAKCPYLLLVDDVTGQGEAGREIIQTQIQHIDQAACLIFINSRDDYCWYDYDHRDQWTSILPVVLKKKKLERTTEDFYASLEDDVIYVYSQNKELLKMVKETEIKKELPHAGISLENRTFTPEQERIKMLEGILAATERRLLYYIEKEQEKK